MTEKYRRMFISAHVLVGLKIVDVQWRAGITIRSSST